MDHVMNTSPRTQNRPWNETPVVVCGGGAVVIVRSMVITRHDLTMHVHGSGSQVTSVMETEQKNEPM